MSDYFLGSGGWYKSIDGSGPYAKDGESYSLMAGGSGTVDVFSATLPEYTPQNAVINEGDTLQVVIEKLIGSDRALEESIPTESDVLNYKLNGLNLSVTSRPITNTDPLLTAIALLQVQNNSLQSTVAGLEQLYAELKAQVDTLTETP